MIVPRWFTSRGGRRARFVPLIECVFCDQEHAADHECLAMKQMLRRHLHALADEFYPTNGTAPDAPGAAYDAPMKGDAS